MIKSNFKLAHFILNLVFIIPFIFLVYIFIILFTNDYQSLIDYVVALADKKEHKPFIQNNLLTENVFMIGRGALLFSLITYIIIFRFVSSNVDQVIFKLKSFYSKLKEIGKRYFVLKKWEALLFFTFFAIFIVKSCYFIEYYEVQYDEAWTYTHFTSKGFIISAFSPNNNHIFYSLFSSFVDFLPIPTKWVIRFPALFAILISLTLGYFYLRHHFGFRTAFLTIFLLASSCSFHFFSILGRGYGFVLLFSMLSFISVLGITTKSKNLKLHYLFFTIASILGLYSNQAYLYVLLGNLIFLIFFQRINYVSARQLFISSIIIALLCCLLYLPSILTGSAEILGSAVSDSKGASTEILHYLNRMSDWLMFGKDWTVFFLLIFIILLFVLVARFLKNNELQKKLLYFSAFTLAFSFLSVLITSVQPPYRVWCFESIYLYIGLGISFNIILRNRLMFAFSAIFILFSNVVFSANHYFMNWSAELDREAKKISEIMLSCKTVSKNCFFFSRYDKPLVEYYFLINKMPLKTYMPFEDSKHYKRFDEDVYDAVLLDFDDYQPTKSDLQIIREKDYHLKYENSRIKLYLLKK